MNTEKILEEIDKLKENCLLSEFESGYAAGAVDMANAIKDVICANMGDGNDTNVPSNDGWIPVEERLPEEGERCIVADKCGYVHDGIIYDYADSKDDKLSFHKWDDEYWQCFRPDVIAWQPLPEPYKPK